MLRRALFASLFAVTACSAAQESATAESSQTGISQRNAGADAGADAGPDVAATATPGQCATSFGDELTPGFGRIDGTVWAVQRPGDETCTMPNGDHIIIQVLMHGAVYRLVTNVKSDRPAADVRVQMLVKDGRADDRMGPVPLPAPAFAEGWHTGDDVWIDYVHHFGVHAEQFTPADQDLLVEDIAARLHVGDPISVYAQSGAGRPESAHLVHRNGHGKDGAIVLHPTTAPTYLLFHFAEQSF